MHWSCPCMQMRKHVCVSQQAHASTQVMATTTHTPQCTTPTIFVQVSPLTPWGGWRNVCPRAPSRGLAGCSGHDCNNGPAAAGQRRQPSHHACKGLAVGEPCLGPVQVLVHDSRCPAGGDADVFHLALSISDLSPSPSLLGTYGFQIGNKGGTGPGFGQHTGGNGGGNGNGIRGRWRPGGMESSLQGSSPPGGADVPSALGRWWQRQQWGRQSRQEWPWCGGWRCRRRCHQVRRQPTLHVEGGADQTVCVPHQGRGSSVGWWATLNLRMRAIWRWRRQMATRMTAKTTATMTMTGGPLPLGVISS